jgi:hypothetical protein
MRRSIYATAFEKIVHQTLASTNTAKNDQDTLFAMARTLANEMHTRNHEVVSRKISERSAVRKRKRVTAASWLDQMFNQSMTVMGEIGDETAAGQEDGGTNMAQDNSQ